MADEQRDLGAHMRRLADVAAQTAAQLGANLDYRPASLPLLDGMIGGLPDWSAKSEPEREGTLSVIGAYFGEVIVRNLNGSWVVNPHTGAPAVRTGEALWDAHAMVAKRWANGEEDSLVIKYAMVSQQLGGAPPQRRAFWRR